MTNHRVVEPAIGLNAVIIVPKSARDLGEKKHKTDDTTHEKWCSISTQSYLTLDGFLRYLTLVIICFAQPTACRQTNQDWVGMIISAISIEKIRKFVRLSQISFRVRNLSIRSQNCPGSSSRWFWCQDIEKSSQDELRTAWDPSECAGSKDLGHFAKVHK